MRGGAEGDWVVDIYVYRGSTSSTTYHTHDAGARVVISSESGLRVIIVIG
jgi:hypothetical protein